ncbi:hypothetical protein NQ315_015440 [Exocentrus adspersus]|uniref:Uncharacterized protein n=1 Tax=Exocentrus adspersus TaxID=1586481 RepID=A0AAV8VMK5_9CUCU|nr:hypothetical protein NQ315_015440 [Exocentrus adspersus]
MEPKEFGCRPEAEKQKGDEDEESLMEECWTAKYKGDSRKWLIRDGSYKNRRGPLMSSMKASYIYPLKEDKDLENLVSTRMLTVVNL